MIDDDGRKDRTVIRLTGLFRSRARDGREFFSGSMGSARLLVFKNTHRRGDRDPELVAYLADNRKAGEDDQGTSTPEPQRHAAARADRQGRGPAPEPPPLGDDDIDFGAWVLPFVLPILGASWML
jgi:hypothetical protein